VGFTQLNNNLAVVEISFEKAIPIHTMSEYNLDLQYNDITYGENEVNFKEFESCTFTNCDFSQCNFIAVAFIDCHLIHATSLVQT
jgi:uncharacterized protein YjbI with pentapeptide repeats